MKTVDDMKSMLERFKIKEKDLKDSIKKAKGNDAYPTKVHDMQLHLDRVQREIKQLKLLIKKANRRSLIGERHVN